MNLVYIEQFTQNYYGHYWNLGLLGSQNVQYLISAGHLDLHFPSLRRFIYIRLAALADAKNFVLK
jgi:hypothetical protein